MPDKNEIHIEEPQSFVIRMWQEGLGRWRGKINHVQSKESRAFTRLEESSRFMAERLPGITVTSIQKTQTKEASGSNSLSRIKDWLPRKRSLRMAIAIVPICVVAAIAVLLYKPADDSVGNIVGTAQGYGLESALVFFLGAVLGGGAVGIWMRLRKKG